MWILTESVNDYNQHGDYFLHAWPSKPSAEEVAKALKAHEHPWDDESVTYTLAGGGRPDPRDFWVNLFEFTG